MRPLLSACCVVAILVGTTGVALAQDSDQARGYLHLKIRDTNNLTGVHDYYGFALGGNLNRYIGVELSGDRFEIFPKVPAGTVGEYGVFTLMPQLRLRYPLLDGKLVPYVLGGGGIALTDFNDRKPNGFGVSIQSEPSTPVGTLGAGIEYFIADNIAIGAEVKYLFAGRQTLRVGGAPHSVDVSTPLTSLGLRLFFPELRPPAPVAEREPAPLRLYLNARAGVALPTATDIGSGIEMRPVPPAIGGELAQYFGLAFGMDIGRQSGRRVRCGGLRGCPGASRAGDGYRVRLLWLHPARPPALPGGRRALGAVRAGRRRARLHRVQRSQAARRGPRHQREDELRRRLGGPRYRLLRREQHCVRCRIEIPVLTGPSHQARPRPFRGSHGAGARLLGRRTRVLLGSSLLTRSGMDRAPPEVDESVHVPIPTTWIIVARPPTAAGTPAYGQVDNLRRVSIQLPSFDLLTEARVKYMLLLCRDEQTWDGLSTTERQQVYAEMLDVWPTS